MFGKVSWFSNKTFLQDESAEKDEGKTVEASSESETKSPGKSEQSEASTSTSENDDSVPESLKKSQEGLKKEADEVWNSNLWLTCIQKNFQPMFACQRG